MKHLNTILLLLALQLPFQMVAQSNKKTTKKKVFVYGDVEDSFTGVGLPALVTVMNSDSTVIDTVTCEVYRNESYFTLEIPKVDGTYIVRADYEGYASNTVTQKYSHSSKEPYFRIPTIKLKKLMRTADDQKTVEMDEVVVKGTRLQVAYRGDTIVYNAAAFNVPEGAMIDALVRQLPGAELKSNGDVYINGEKVEYITLNGNDFFRGSNKVVLENLPYFVVKELRAYHRANPLSIDTMKDKSENPFVLDVLMKREYARSVIANGEAGIGTDHRWKAKLFALRYTDFHRFAVFGNVNNVNEDRQPGTDGDWSPHKQGKGLFTTRQAGMNYELNNQKKTLSLSQKLVAEWTDANNETRQSGETYATPQNIFSGSNSLSRAKDLDIEDRFNLSARLGDLYLSSYAFLKYVDRDYSYADNDSTWSDQPVNRTALASLSGNRRLNANGYVGVDKFINRIWRLSIILNFSYYNAFRDRGHSLRNISYLSQDTADGRNDYRDNSASSYSYNLELGNDFRISSKFSFNVGFRYGQNGSGKDNDYYRLWDFDDRYEREMLLPSTTDSMQLAFDMGNSYDYFTIDRSYCTMLQLRYRSGGASAYLYVPYYYHRQWIDYQNNGVNLFRRRSYGQWTPTLSYIYRFSRNELRATYRFTPMKPSFDALMPLTDNTDPLYIRTNNPSLRSKLHSNIEIRLSMKPKKGPSWWLAYNLTADNRAWGNRIGYDRLTGVYTSITDNVNGNWNTELRGGLTGTIDKKRHLSYDVSANLRYFRSVDFDIAYDGEANRLSKVNTFRPEATWKLNYRLGGFSAGALVKTSRNFSHNTTIDEPNVNIREYKFGLNSQYTIPVLKITVGTDLSLYSQRGYSSDYMNTNDWIWNATLSRAFLKGRLVARVDGYDILHQMTTRRYSVNAQGHTETWYNSIPRYFMFTLAFRIAKSNKSK